MQFGQRKAGLRCLFPEGCAASILPRIAQLLSLSIRVHCSASSFIDGQEHLLHGTVLFSHRLEGGVLWS